MPWVFAGWAAFIVAVVALSLLDESHTDRRQWNRCVMVILACLAVGEAAS